MRNLVVFVASSIFLLPAMAEDKIENAIYLGTGNASKTNSVQSSERPFSLGYLRLASDSDTVWGLDLGSEGVMIDSTGGRYNSTKAALSYNFLFGKNLFKGESSRFDSAFLVGMRQSSSTCDKSYLGYQCYADTDPKNDYKVNYGVVLTWSFKNALIGIRATGESKQGFAGFRF